MTEIHDKASKKLAFRKKIVKKLHTKTSKARKNYLKSCIYCSVRVQSSV